MNVFIYICFHSFFWQNFIHNVIFQPRPSGEKIAAIAEKLDLKKNVVRVCANQQSLYFLFWNFAFLKPRLFAGLVLQPASEAEENEVRGSREHPLAATLLPRKKSKFSISRTAIGTGEICYHNFRFKYSISSSCLSCILSEKKVFFLEKKSRLATLSEGQYCCTQFTFVVWIGNC